MKLIFLALVITILYQMSTQAMARVNSRASGEGNQQKSPGERKPLLSREKNPTVEKDITHRGRVLRD